MIENETEQRINKAQISIEMQSYNNAQNTNTSMNIRKKTRAEMCCTSFVSSEVSVGSLRSALKRIAWRTVCVPRCESNWATDTHKQVGKK